MKANFQKNFLRIFKKVRNFQTQTFLAVKNFKRLLISIPKCIELNSELILALGQHPGPRPNIHFYFGEKSEHNPILYNEQNFQNYNFNVPKL